MNLPLLFMDSLTSFEVDENAETRYGPGRWKELESNLFEPDQVAAILKDLKERQFVAFIDVGASNGVYSLLAAPRVTKVIAIEPDKDQYTALQKNFRLNPEFVTECIRGFVSPATRIELSPYSIDQARNSMGEIALVNLAEVVDRHAPSLLKVDIEGGGVASAEGQKLNEGTRRH